MGTNCFSIYFSPIYIYIKKVFELAFQNDAEIGVRAISFMTVYQLICEIIKIDFFGVPNFLLFLVILTVLIDASFGISKSIKQSKEYSLEASLITEDSPEKRMLLKKVEIHKFDPKKLQFTFFKCLTLLGYLYFAKHILSVENNETSLSSIIGFASDVVTKAPLAIFWYYDFKSIGDNSAYLYGKKAPIFNIIEKIFEPKINNFFNNDKEV